MRLRSRALVVVGVVAIGVVASGRLVRAQPGPVGAPIPGASAAAGVTGLPAPATSGVTLNEAPADPLSPATRTLAGWNEVWATIDKSNVDMRIALSEIERAEAATRIAYGAALPTLTASATITHVPGNGTGSFSTVPTTGSTYDLLSMNLSFSMPLVNLRAWHAIETSKVLEDVARMSLFDVRRRVGLSLARAAVAIASAQRLAELNRVQLQMSLDRLLLTRKRLAAGVGDARDLVRAQQDVATARAAIPAADEQLREAREGLAAVLQISGDVGLAGEPEAIEQQIMSFCTPTSDQNPNEKRIDVLIAEKEIEVAERNVDDIALKFVPTLTVQLSANATGLAFAGPFATGWSASGVLSIPLYDGGVRYGEMRDRKALVEEAKAKAVSATVGAFIEIAQARRAIDVAVAAQTAAREARDLAAEADRLQRIAYAAGIGTNFDLIDAGRTLRTAETQLILRDLDLASARLSLPFLQGNCTGTKTKE
jgi:outer membrane protein TolC